MVVGAGMGMGFIEGEDCPQMSSAEGGCEPKDWCSWRSEGGRKAS